MEAVLRLFSHPHAAAKAALFVTTALLVVVATPALANGARAPVANKPDWAVTATRSVAAPATRPAASRPATASVRATPEPMSRPLAAPRPAPAATTRPRPVVARTTSAITPRVASTPSQVNRPVQLAQYTAPTPGPAPVPRAPQQRAPVAITLPLKDGSNYLGDVVARFAPDGSPEIQTDRAYELLSRILDPRAIERLKASNANKSALTLADFEAGGIPIRYDAQSLEIIVSPPPSARASRSLQVSAIDRAKIGSFDQPAQHSAYLNVRGSVDYIHEGLDVGLGDPTFQLDGAFRLGDWVVESEGLWRPNADLQATYQHLGTRWVWDDTTHLFRVTAGDLRTTGRGFQSAPQMGGLSIVRSYSVLEPQFNVRPRGAKSFSLVEASNVEVLVNNQNVRRLRLQAGTYNLSDFPFAQGANDVRLIVENPAGQRETISFNVFLDRAQLGVGLTEFGLYTGFQSSQTERGLAYDGPAGATGFIRRGLTENVTAGVNGQFDDDGWMAGFEGITATSWANVSFDLAFSDLKDAGAGTGGLVTIQRLFQSSGSGSALNFSFETRSRRFGGIGAGIPDNPYAWETSLGLSRALGQTGSISLDARHSEGRGTNSDASSIRASASVRVNSALSFSSDATWEDGARGDDFSVRFAMIFRLGTTDTLRAEYDTRDDRMRLGLQGFRGRGVGAFNYNAEVERTPGSGGFNGSLTYLANRAELGLAHFTQFDEDFSGVIDQRSSFRFGSAIGWADGSFAIGRPVYDAFAIVRPHNSIEAANISLNPDQGSYTSRTGALGTALVNDLGAYAERTLSLSVDGAPAGYDIGKGSFRVFPGYRQGYNLMVGSDYSMTAGGRFLDEEGKPISLLAGTVTEQGKDGQSVTVFTNRDGRFLIGGLRAGIWIVSMPTNPTTRYVLTIPETRDGVARLGDLRPSAADSSTNSSR
jgi:outer membrane usher protein